MDQLKIFIKEIYEKKFSLRDGKKLFVFTEKIKKHPQYDNLLNFINEKYIIQGYGIKTLIKDFELPISYSSLRNLLFFLNIKPHTPNKANDFLKKRRSYNAKIQAKEHTGMYSREVQLLLKNKNSNIRGISGYYWNVSKNKYVWLRSSWEFIYAKWLNKNKINWDVECTSYKIIYKNIEYYYRPDFFIFNENNELSSIIEIKGYWKDKTFKFDELKNKLKDIDMVLITNITPYLDQNLNNEIKLWKQLRKLELKK